MSVQNRTCYKFLRLFFLLACINDIALMADIGTMPASSSTSDMVWGAVLPLHGEGQLAQDGLNAAIGQCNRSGGLQGMQVALHALNDFEDVKDGIDAIKTLLPQTHTIINVVTHGIIEQTRALREKDQVLFFGPQENGTNIQVPEDHFLINTRASLHDELAALVAYAIETLKKRSIAIFFEESSWGNNGLDLIEQLIAPYHQEDKFIRIVAKGSHQQDTVDVAAAVKKIVRAKPDAIICVAGRHATYKFIPAVLNAGLVHTAFLGCAELLPLQLHLKKTRGIDFIATSCAPDPVHSELPLVQEFRRDLATTTNNSALPTPLALSGYMNALFLAALIKTCNTPITSDAIVRAAESCTNLDVGGITLSFDAQRRSLYRSLWLSIGVGTPWKEIDRSVKGLA